MGSSVALSTSRTSADVGQASRGFLGLHSNVHTSFCDFCKRQAGTALEIDILRVYQYTQSMQWLSAEEVCLASLGSYQLLYLPQQPERLRSPGIAVSLLRPLAPSRPTPARTDHLSVGLDDRIST